MQSAAVKARIFSGKIVPLEYPWTKLKYLLAFHFEKHDRNRRNQHSITLSTNPVSNLGVSSADTPARLPWGVFLISPPKIVVWLNVKETSRNIYRRKIQGTPSLEISTVESGVDISNFFLCHFHTHIVCLPWSSSVFLSVTLLESAIMNIYSRAFYFRISLHVMKNISQQYILDKIIICCSKNIFFKKILNSRENFVFVLNENFQEGLILESDWLQKWNKHANFSETGLACHVTQYCWNLIGSI